MRAWLAAAALLLAAGGARAQEPLSGTLLAIGDRGTIRIGVRDGAVPFSFRNRGGEPVGFSVDICHGIAADVAAALNRDLLEPQAPAWQTGIRIAYVPVAADERIPMVQAGAIDLECGSTTATAERAKLVAFSPVFFLAGTKLAVPPGNAVASWRDMAGRTVAVGTGTTNAAVLQRLAPSLSPPAGVETVPSVEAAFAALEAGRAAAVASDDILLAGLIAAKGLDARIVGDYLSFEPYAIMLRRDDPAFLDLVRQSFGARRNRAPCAPATAAGLPTPCPPAAR